MTPALWTGVGIVIGLIVICIIVVLVVWMRSRPTRIPSGNMESINEEELPDAVHSYGIGEQRHRYRPYTSTRFSDGSDRRFERRLAAIKSEPAGNLALAEYSDYPVTGPIASHESRRYGPPEGLTHRLQETMDRIEEQLKTKDNTDELIHERSPRIGGSARLGLNESHWRSSPIGRGKDRRVDENGFAIRNADPDAANDVPIRNLGRQSSANRAGANFNRYTNMRNGNAKQEQFGANYRGRGQPYSERFRLNNQPKQELTFLNRQSERLAGSIDSSYRPHLPADSNFDRHPQSSVAFKSLLRDRSLRDPPIDC